MQFKILLTGSTGYIGGTVLDELVKQHPEYAIATLHRKNPPAEFTRRYPNVSVIKGDFDSDEVLQQAAAMADCVVHCGDTDHEAALRSLIAGLTTTPASYTRPNATSPPRDKKHKYLIHLSGAGIASDFLPLSSSSPPYPYGNMCPKIWSDVTDVQEIWEQPDNALHRQTEKLVEQCWREHGDIVRTAIVTPSDIYGAGRGTKGTRSIWLPFFVEQSQKQGGAFYVGEGQNIRGWVHIDDLARLYLRIVESAAAEFEAGGSAGTEKTMKGEWGEQGYFFTATQEVSQLDIATKVGKFLAEKKVVEDATPKRISEKDVNEMKFDRFGGGKGLSLFLFASNTRQNPERGRRLFGWEPSEGGLWECIDQDLAAIVV